MVNKPPFDKTDNPFTQIPLFVKKPNPVTCTCNCSGGRRIPSCHTPSIPTHSISPKNPIFIWPLTAFPKVPSPHLMKAVQTHSWRRFLWETGKWCQWWNKKCSSESWNTKCCSLCAVKWQLHFLCWHLFPRPSLSYKPSWKPSPWNFTLNYPKRWMSNYYVKE